MSAACTTPSQCVECVQLLLKLNQVEKERDQLKQLVQSSIEQIVALQDRTTLAVQAIQQHATQAVQSSQQTATLVVQAIQQDAAQTIQSSQQTATHIQQTAVQAIAAAADAVDDAIANANNQIHQPDGLSFY